MKAALLNRPSAFTPVVMSSSALAIVLGYAAMFGVARQADEGMVAHVWQSLMDLRNLPLIHRKLWLRSILPPRGERLLCVATTSNATARGCSDWLVSTTSKASLRRTRMHYIS